MAVGYGQGEERFSGYEFAVKVLDGNTPHAKDAPALLQQLIASTGEMFRSQLVICQEYVRNPLLTDGRNPIIANVNGVEVYIRDELEPTRDLERLGVRQLGFHLTPGSRARAIRRRRRRAHCCPCLRGSRCVETREGRFFPPRRLIIDRWRWPAQALEWIPYCDRGRI
ncbi:MAG: hypothetical protein LC114_23620 [Bryobacterales bacterium]|nr:hypothetical protein [Bryobacterales bacterium]